MFLRISIFKVLKCYVLEYPKSGTTTFQISSMHENYVVLPYFLLMQYCQLIQYVL